MLHSEDYGEVDSKRGLFLCLGHSWEADRELSKSRGPVRGPAAGQLHFLKCLGARFPSCPFPSNLYE